MKKRILLSLVSFFMMTAMWASLVDAYQIYVTAGANGKTGATAELTLNMKNRNAIWSWGCTVVLPEGVTFESAELVPARYPEGYNAAFTATVQADGSVYFYCEGEEGVALTGTDGAVATVTVKIAPTAPVGDATVNVLAGCKLVEADGSTIHEREKDNPFTWTIEKGEDTQKGDVNGDTFVDIADGVTVLNAMAGEEIEGDADVNGDGFVDIADFVTVLNIMAGEE